jgi:hypothetical protein
MVEGHCGVQRRRGGDHRVCTRRAVRPNVGFGAVRAVLRRHLELPRVQQRPDRGDDPPILHVGRVRAHGEESDGWRVRRGLVDAAQRDGTHAALASFLRRRRRRLRWPRRLCAFAIGRRWRARRRQRWRTLRGVEWTFLAARWEIPADLHPRRSLKRHVEDARQRGLGTPGLQIADVSLKGAACKVEGKVRSRTGKLCQQPRAAGILHPQLRRELRAEIRIRERRVARKQHAREYIGALVGEDVVVG